MVFDQPDLSDLTVSFWTVLLPTVVGMCIFAGVIVFSVGRSMRLAETAGVDEMIGLVGRAASRIDPRGKIFVRGEYWNVDASDGMKSVGGGQAAADGAVEAAIEEGEAVEIVGVDGLTLRVRRAGS
jgi:membrane-bound serine protease (ClpP class)